MKDGLGVDAYATDMRRMDNAGRIEALKFEFNEAVSLTSIDLKHDYAGANFMLSPDNVVWKLHKWDGGFNWDTHTRQLSSNNTFSDTWYLAVSDEGINDGFFVSKIDVAAVPLPAAAWLFGSALLGVFGFGARRRAS